MICNTKTVKGKIIKTPAKRIDKKKFSIINKIPNHKVVIHQGRKKFETEQQFTGGAVKAILEKEGYAKIAHKVIKQTLGIPKGQKLRFSLKHPDGKSIIELKKKKRNIKNNKPSGTPSGASRASGKFFLNIAQPTKGKKKTSTPKQKVVEEEEVDLSE